MPRVSLDDGDPGPGPRPHRRGAPSRRRGRDLSPETRMLSCAHPTGFPKSTPSRWLSIRRPPSHPACKFRHFLRLHRYSSRSVVPGPAASAPPGTVPRNSRCQTHGTGVPGPRSGEPCLPEGDNERSSWGTSARCVPGPGAGTPLRSAVAPTDGGFDLSWPSLPGPAGSTSS